MLSPAPSLDSRLSAVVARSASNAWAVGTSFDANDGVHPFALHWDGRFWTQAIAPAGITHVAALGASATGDLWVAGDAGGQISQGVAMPLAQAQIAVNANSALAESGYLTQSVAAANLAPGTNPAVAVQPDGSSEAAWQASSGLLWTLDSAGSKVNTQQQVASGTSPAIAALPNTAGRYEVVFASASGNALTGIGPGGTAGALGSGPAVAAGTSPVVAAAGNGGLKAAYHATGTDHLWTVTQAGGVLHRGGHGRGREPSVVAALAGGGFEVVYPNVSGALTGIGPDGSARALGSGPAVAAGTSPGGRGRHRRHAGGGLPGSRR